MSCMTEPEAWELVASILELGQRAISKNLKKRLRDLLFRVESEYEKQFGRIWCPF